MATLPLPAATATTRILLLTRARRKLPRMALTATATAKITLLSSPIGPRSPYYQPRHRSRNISDLELPTYPIGRRRLRTRLRSGVLATSGMYCGNPTLVFNPATRSSATPPPMVDRVISAAWGANQAWPLPESGKFWQKSNVQETMRLMASGNDIVSPRRQAAATVSEVNRSRTAATRRSYSTRSATAINDFCVA